MYPTEPQDDPIRIYMNSNLDTRKWSRGKYAAHAVHAALTAFGVHTGQPVVVLGAKPRDILKMRTVIHDEGRTELQPGTLTAGTNTHFPIEFEPDILNQARAKHRVWAYRPEWYWWGWSTLLPINLSHDELARRTLMLGWTLTGRVVIALWPCNELWCWLDARKDLLEQKALKDRFEFLRDAWWEGTKYSSSTNDTVEHPAYQELIAMGDEILPFVLKDLEETNRHWFHLLATVTGQDAAQGLTKVREAASAWVAWGKKEGYL